MADGQAFISVPTAQRIIEGVKRVEAMPSSSGAGGPNQQGWNPFCNRLRVKSVSDDYLICRTWDGTNEGTSDIYVAKPYTLRKTPYHGKTITFNGTALTFSYSNGVTRSVSKSGGSETQIIIPAYTGTGSGYGGEEIHAIFAYTGLRDPSNRPIGLLDANIDGRAWAKQ